LTAGLLYQWLVSTAKERGQATALTFVESGDGKTVSYTYESLFEHVELLATRLRTRYDNPNGPLGLLLASQQDQVLHYLAALSIGAVPAILTPPNRKLNRDYYAQTMSAVLRRCQFGALVTDVGEIDFEGLVMTPHDLEVRSGRRPSHHDVVIPSSQIKASFMQFSSGTTGIKKGVLVDDEAVIKQLKAYSAALQLSDQDCIVSWLPLYHDMGFIACLNMPLAYGVHTVMIDPIDWVGNPAIYLRKVSEHQGTLSWHPNFAYAFMANRVHDRAIEGVNLSSLRGLVNCSEPVTYGSQSSFLERFTNWGLSDDVFRGCYAMAETTFALTHGEPDDPGYLDPVGPKDNARSPGHAQYVSVGRPLPGVELKIMDADRQVELSEREMGEIWVSSPFNFTGYFNDEVATSTAFVGDWYRTGDLGYRVGSAFYVVGRSKDLLVVAGVNVFPQEIEEVVSQVDGVYPGRVSTFSVFDEKLQTERVVIVAESDAHNGSDKGRIVLEIRQRILAGFQIGNFEVTLVPRQWLVKSTSGKIARNANRQKWLEEVNVV
jgi:fatty-acyl-CoA synthase